MILRLFGAGLLVTCLGVVYLFEGSASSSIPLLHWPAMILTGIGPLALVIFCFDKTLLGRTFAHLFSKNPVELQAIHEKEGVFLHKLGQGYYKEGASVLDTVNTKNFSSFIGKVTEYLSMQVPMLDIIELVQTERNKFISRTYQCIGVVNLGMRLAPSLGMLGTILGMVRLLAVLDDPAKIGSQMSLALLTTFYGLFFSICVWTPFQQKIERVLEIEIEGYDQALRWLEFLSKRKPSSYFADSSEIKTPENDKKVA